MVRLCSPAVEVDEISAAVVTEAAVLEFTDQVPGDAATTAAVGVFTHSWATCATMLSGIEFMRGGRWEQTCGQTWKGTIAAGRVC